MVQVFVKSVLNSDVSKLKLQNRKFIQFMISKKGSTKLKNVRTMMYVESLLSRYENHFNSSRKLCEANALHKMIISENRPALRDVQVLVRGGVC